MFKYYRKGHDEEDYKEISYGKALDILLGTYNDSDLVRDMLQTANWIRCRFSWLKVTKIMEDGRELVMMPGYMNMIPDGNEYDDDGNRIKEEE